VGDCELCLSVACIHWCWPNTNHNASAPADFRSRGGRFGVGGRGAGRRMRRALRLHVPVTPLVCQPQAERRGVYPVRWWQCPVRGGRAAKADAPLGYVFRVNWCAAGRRHQQMCPREQKQLRMCRATRTESIPAAKSLQAGSLPHPACTAWPCREIMAGCRGARG
jgi:hypothetical protein